MGVVGSSTTNIPLVLVTPDEQRPVKLHSVRSAEHGTVLLAGWFETSTQGGRVPERITESDVHSFRARLEAWADTLDLEEQALAFALVKLADGAAPDEIAGFSFTSASQSIGAGALAALLAAGRDEEAVSPDQ